MRARTIVWCFIAVLLWTFEAEVLAVIVAMVSVADGVMRND
jgi:hypothetical protein